MPRVRRLYLSDYQDIDPHSGVVWQLLKLISARDVQETIALAQQLTQQSELLNAETLNFIETVLAYRLPHLSLEEIHAMLNLYELNEVRLQDTQFYKDVARIEGEKARREGLARGLQKGLREGMKKGVKQGVQQGIQQGLQKGVEQGIQQGLQKGVEQGEQKAKAEALLTLMTLKFGASSAGVEARVKGARVEELDGWIQRILTAESVEALLG